jgi:hypothetical protein
MPIAARPAFSGRSTGRVAAWSGEVMVEVMRKVLFWPGGPRYS